ncbi:RHS repeat-associated core domain-containing protein [candidate division WOR-3 bacterium]|nr:RHS repeat-associated core domain-containing protein [candidate division WOR-3 bacterium]
MNFSYYKRFYWNATKQGDYYEGTFLPDSIRRTRGANRKYKDSYLYDDYGNDTLHIDPLGNHFNYQYYILDHSDQGLSNDFYVVDKVRVAWSSYELTYYSWYHVLGLPHPHVRLGSKKEMIDPIEYAKTKYEDYDDYGNCRKITAPEDNITEFSYDDIFEDGEWYYSGNHGFWTKKRIVYTPIKFFNDHGDSTKPGLLIKSRNPNGQITRYPKYDWRGRIKEIKKPDDTTPSIKFLYNDEAGNKSSEIWRYFDSSDKYSTLYRFDDFDRVFQRNKIDLIYPGYDTLSTEYTHTFMDKTASETSPKGTKTSISDYDYTKYYKYDAIGRLKEVIQPFEVLPTGEGMRGYSGTDKLKTLYNYSILNSNFTYTIDGHAVTLTYAEKTTITDPRAKKKDFIYDANGQLRAVREINGSDTLTTYYDYDFRGRLTAIKDAKGREVTYSYDFRGNLIERDHFDLDNPETFTYNKNAMLTKKIKPDSMAIRYEYDRINRVTKVKYGSAGETSVVDDFEGTFNWHSRPISDKCHLDTDAHNGSYSMKVDILENPQFAVRQIDDNDWSLFDSLTLWYKFPQDPVYPERIIQVLVWDSNEDYISSAQIVQVDKVWHRLALDLNDEDFDKSDIDSTAVKVFKSETRGGGRVSENVLVDDIQVKSAKFTKVTYKYDSYDAGVTPPTGLNYPKNHLTKMTDESGWTMYFYDKRGRLGEKWVNFTDITADTLKVHYNYNKADQITSITYPGDVTVGYQFDEFGRTKKVTGLSTTLATITYDPNSRDSIINYGNGVESKFFYYPTEWVKSINTSHEELGTFINNSYEYDSTGNRIKDGEGGSPSASYEYDDLNRITNEDHYLTPWNVDADYTYDAVGNRDSVNLVNYIYYPGTDRLKTVGIITYYYDENGNITGLSSGTSIEYDYGDMPTKITESGGTIYTFSYNGDGLRVKKHRQTGGDSEAQPNENYYFIHDENGNVLCDIDKEGSIKARYIYANGKHITKIEGSNMYYYHCDPVGSPLVITRRYPSIAKQYNYTAFGEMKYHSGTYYDNHRFTGKEEDGTGLYYFGARYYDKSIGRWITLDPKSHPSGLRLKHPQSLNPYVYCWNNPLNRIDKDGNFGITLGIASLVATGVGIAVTTDYLVQWKKSGKSIKEFYKSGEYPVTREGTVAILGGITGLIGGAFGASTLTAGKQFLWSAGVNLGTTSIKSKLLDDKMTTKRGIATVVGTAFDQVIPGAGFSLEPAITPIVEPIIDKIIKQLDDEISNTPPVSGAFLEQPNKVREELLLRRPDLKEER